MEGGMNTVAEMNDTFAKLMATVQQLQAENERLREERGATWKLQSELADTKHRLTTCERKLEDERRENDQLRRDNTHWRKAVRYEQWLKKPRKRVHHLPIYNDVRRARDKYGDWVNRERVFLRHWRKENKRVSGTNGGCGVLELILSEDPNGHAVDLTQRDATVAATVIQWLGTNCGYAFLHEVERETERLRQTKRKGVA